MPKSPVVDIIEYVRHLDKVATDATDTGTKYDITIEVNGKRLTTAFDADMYCAVEEALVDKVSDAYRHMLHDLVWLANYQAWAVKHGREKSFFIKYYKFGEEIVNPFDRATYIGEAVDKQFITSDWLIRGPEIISKVKQTAVAIYNELNSALTLTNSDTLTLEQAFGAFVKVACHDVLEYTPFMTLQDCVDALIDSEQYYYETCELLLTLAFTSNPLEYAQAIAEHGVSGYTHAYNVVTNNKVLLMGFAGKGNQLLKELAKALEDDTNGGQTPMG